MQNIGDGFLVEVSDPAFAQKAKDLLNDKGIVVVRGILDPAQLDTLCAKSKSILKQPAISGSVGYYMKDPNKKLYDSLLLGRESISATVDNRIIDLLEGFFGKEIVMSDGFLKHDFGNGRVYFPYHSHTGNDLDLNGHTGAFGIGLMMYLHDTEAGAFCFAPGTHKLNSPHGNDPQKYPEPMRSEIIGGLRRVVGKRGDVILFDGRGFHGPEQPVAVPRTVLLLAYNPVAYCKGGGVRFGSPVYITDLTGLDARQLRVLGVGLKSAVPPEKFHVYAFNKSSGYKIATMALNFWFAFSTWKDRVKDVLRPLLGRSAPAYNPADV